MVMNEVERSYGQEEGFRMIGWMMGVIAVWTSPVIPLAFDICRLGMSCSQETN